MATIKYLTKGKNNPTTIFIRLRDGRSTDLTVSTGYVINPKFWNNASGKVKLTADNDDKISFKKKLEKLEEGIFDKLNEDKGTGVHISKEWLEKVIEKIKNPAFEKKVDTLKSMLEAYQAEMKVKINPKTGKKISPDTIRNFTTTVSRLKLFEKHQKRNYAIHEIDFDFHADFTRFLRENLTLSPNSINKDIKQIKTVCTDAKHKGYSINDHAISRKFSAPTEPTTFVTITEEEIEKIKEVDAADYLNNARDWLIIGCWTGCRVGDLMKLSKANIHTNPKKQKFIRYTQSKTGKQVDLPIHPDVEAILKKRGDFPRPIADQLFNKWIKKVCEKAKMTQLVQGTRQNKDTHKKEVGTFKKYELVRSHTCRRSFATNHYNKLPNKLIMAVTGHSTEKMLLHYIGETENAHLDDFMNVWAKSK